MGCAEESLNLTHRLEMMYIDLGYSHVNGWVYCSLESISGHATLDLILYGQVASQESRLRGKGDKCGIDPTKPSLSRSHVDEALPSFTIFTNGTRDYTSTWRIILGSNHHDSQDGRLQRTLLVRVLYLKAFVYI